MELVMFGDGHEPGGPAQQFSKRRRIEVGIEFAGAQPYEALMTRLARSVDVLVHPSREEAHCMAVTEAMAMAIPVIGGVNSGGIPWALAYGKAGVLVNVESPSSIASGMRTILENEGLRSRLAQSARQKAHEEYRLDEVAARYEKVLVNARLEQAH